MIVHLYALNFNEMRILPSFIKHYEPFVDKFYIFDDRSDDGSVEYLSAHPKVVLSQFTHDADGYIAAATRFYNSAWKASRGVADWVIVVNIDEFVDHPKLMERLAALRAQGFTAIQCIGWEMVSDTLPGPEAIATVRRGVRSEPLDKIAVFDPDAIEDMGFTVGRHTATITGRCRVSRDHGFRLLHYKFLGQDYFVSRYAELNGRRGPDDVAHARGRKYEAPVEELKRLQLRLEAGAREATLKVASKAGQARKLARGSFVARHREVRNDNGSLREIWAQGDPWCENVRQVYRTTTKPGVTKAWYRHRRQTDAISVLSGKARFVLYDDRESVNPRLHVVEIDGACGEMLTIPPLVWHGFACVGDEPLVLLHLNDRIYDWVNVDEEKIDSDSDRIPY